MKLQLKKGRNQQSAQASIKCAQKFSVPKAAQKRLALTQVERQLKVQIWKQLNDFHSSKTIWFRFFFENTQNFSFSRIVNLQKNYILSVWAVL